MLVWLIGVAVFVLLWGALWKASPKAAYGVVCIGLPIAWILSRLMTPYVTGMNEIPLWVPPLPIALDRARVVLLRYQNVAAAPTTCRRRRTSDRRARRSRPSLSAAALSPASASRALRRSTL